MNEHSGQRVDTCGRCGSDVASETEVCPACGAVLAAYRNPLEPAPVQRQAIARSVPEIQEPIAATAASEEPSGGARATDLAALNDARSRLLAALNQPQVRLLDIVERPHSEPTPTRVRETRQTPAPVKRVTPAKAPIAPRAGTVSPARPRKPGFVVAGTVEPVGLIGGVLIIAGLLAVFGGAVADSAFIEAAGIVVTGMGVALIVFAVAVALVRRDQERG